MRDMIHDHIDGSETTTALPTPEQRARAWQQCRHRYQRHLSAWASDMLHCRQRGYHAIAFELRGRRRAA